VKVAQGRVRALAGALALGMALLAGAAPAGAAGAPVPAPDFVLPTYGGSNVRLSSLRGQVVVVNFWASWCAPCRRELPGLQRLWTRLHSGGLEVLAVNVDEAPQQAGQMAQRLGLAFPVLLDPRRELARLYDLRTLPSTLVIDRDGRLRFIDAGFHEDSSEVLGRQVAELMRE
jgi:peroxiredoxin